MPVSHSPLPPPASAPAAIVRLAAAVDEADLAASFHCDALRGEVVVDHTGLLKGGVPAKPVSSTQWGYVGIADDVPHFAFCDRRSPPRAAAAQPPRLKGGDPFSLLAIPQVPSMITGAQMRAARALLQWSTGALARRCGLPQELIREAESINGAPNLEAEEIAAIESALKAGGVEFIGGKYHGVRMKRDR
jgi:hypothetical protein